MFVEHLENKFLQDCTIRASHYGKDEKLIIGTEKGLSVEYDCKVEGNITISSSRQTQLQSGITCIIEYEGNIIYGLNTGHIMLKDPEGTLTLMSSKSGSNISCLEVCGEYLFAGSWDSSIYVYKGKQFIRATSNLCGASVLALCNIDDRYIVAGGADGSLCICDIDTIESNEGGRWYIVSHAHNQPVRSIVNISLSKKLQKEASFGNIVAYIASTGNDGVLHIHAVKDDPVIHVVPDPLVTFDDPYCQGQFAYSLSYDSETSSLVMCGADVTFSIYEVIWNAEEAEDEDMSESCQNVSVVVPSLKLSRKVPSPELIWNCHIIRKNSNEFYVVVSGESKNIDVFRCTKTFKDEKELVGLLQRDYATVCSVETGGSNYGNYNLIPASRFTNSHKSIIPTDDILQANEVLNTSPYPEGEVVLALDPKVPGNVWVFCASGCKWVKLGYVTPGDGNGVQQKIPGPDGQYYDFEFPIEVEDRKYSMFVNRGENPYLAADRVLRQNPTMTPGMDVESYKRQIAEFLVKNMPKDKVNDIFKNTQKRGIKRTSDELFIKACNKSVQILRSKEINADLLELLSIAVEEDNLDDTIFGMFPQIYMLLGKIIFDSDCSELKKSGASENIVDIESCARLTGPKELFPFFAVLTYMMDKSVAKAGNIDSMSYLFGDSTLELCLEKLIENTRDAASVTPIYYLNITRFLCVTMIYIMKSKVSKDATWIDMGSVNHSLNKVLTRLQSWLYAYMRTSKLSGAMRDNILNDLVSFFDISRKNGLKLTNISFML